MKKTKLILVAIASIFLATSALARNKIPSWDTFALGLDPVSISISRNGDELKAENVLKIDGKEKNLKTSALAMAIGYCVYLKLTNLAEELENAGAGDKINEIMITTNINQWLATAWQESGFCKATTTQSGFYQIDNHPPNLAENMKYNDQQKYYPYYAFLEHLKGGTDVGPDQAKLCQVDEEGFVWASVEKGYYEAISYLRNKVAYPNEKGIQPYDGFNFAEWAVAYTNQTSNTTRYPYPPQGKEQQPPPEGITLSSAFGLEQILSWMYNRGQFPLVNVDHEPTMKINEMIRSIFRGKGEKPISEFIKYEQTGEDSDWGKRYIWQLPWLCTMLNNSNNFYSENISEEDVIDVLNILKGFYNGDKTDTPDKVINGGIEEVKKKNWDSAYNSKQTFISLYAVVEHMMEESKTIR
jgi:hypothetical protein